MELTHTFTVPTPVEETWAHFQDIAALADCFPGAQVTSAEGDSFEGTCKVKLGPIALVYTGSGTFTERDDAAHRFVVAAKGRDKRGNGTAGADVTLTMAESGGGTVVEVVTDLAITGKPAQFGRGVMQDVSDKLLGQFVACLEDRLGSAAADEGPVPAAPEDPPVAEHLAARGSVVAQSGGSGRRVIDDAPGGTSGSAGTGPAPAQVAGEGDGGRGAGASSPNRPDGTGASATASVGSVPRASDGADEMDLGAALLPVLVKSYGKQIALGVVGLLILRWVVKRIRR